MQSATTPFHDKQKRKWISSPDSHDDGRVVLMMMIRLAEQTLVVHFRFILIVRRHAALDAHHCVTGWHETDQHHRPTHIRCRIVYWFDQVEVESSSRIIWSILVYNRVVHIQFEKIFSFFQIPFGLCPPNFGTAFSSSLQTHSLCGHQSLIYDIN